MTTPNARTARGPPREETRSSFKSVRCTASPPGFNSLNRAVSLHPFPFPFPYPPTIAASARRTTGRRASRTPTSSDPPAPSRSARSS
eukprot:31165-Pelagococcus_subviridis.AAC.2